MRSYLILIAFILNILAHANYESTYERENIKLDFERGQTDKYQTERISYYSNEQIKALGITPQSETFKQNLKKYADNILDSYGNKDNKGEKQKLSTPPPKIIDFTLQGLLNAKVCSNINSGSLTSDNVGYTGTIYSLNLTQGKITCMYARKGDLRNPKGLFTVFFPELKKYYSLDKTQAKKDQAALLKIAQKQFEPMYAELDRISKSVENENKESYLDVTQILMAAILTDTDIIDVEATRDLGRLQLKDNFTSKYTQDGKSGDNRDLILTDASTIFKVYEGFSDVSMGYLILLTVFFGVWGVTRLVSSHATSKLEKNQSSEKPISYGFGLVMGILLFFPTADHENIQTPDGETVAHYNIMKTRYQDFEKSGYYLFSEWANDVAKVAIDAEMDAIISKTGIGTETEIVNTYAAMIREVKLRDFYSKYYSSCKNDFFKFEAMHPFGNNIYSESENRVFPLTENYLFASSLYHTGGENTYSLTPTGLIKSSTAYSQEALKIANDDAKVLERFYPKVAISSCSKANIKTERHQELLDSYIKKFTELSNIGSTDSQKIKMLTKLVTFQFELYREWGFLSILGLPVTKMQTEYIGGLYEKNNEVLDKLNEQVKEDSNGAHMIMSSIPYMFIPGASSVYTVISDNSGKLGSAIGGAAGSPGGLTSIVTGIIGGVVGTVSGSALGMWGAYHVSKTVLELAPIIGIVIIGLVRFIIIMIKIFSFHFASLFLMPIMFAKENIQAISKFSMKIFATMLELPMFVLAVWLAITANSLIHNIGDVFSKKIILGMLSNIEVQYAGVEQSIMNNSWLAKLKIYLFDGFMEVAISVFSIVIIYKLIITLHNSLFEVLEIQGSQSLDNSLESMKNEAGGYGSKI